MRPHHIVPMKHMMITPEGMAIMKLAAVNSDVARIGMPVAYMWWTHSPNDRMPIATSGGDVRAVRPASRRRAATVMIAAAIPTAGMSWM